MSDYRGVKALRGTSGQKHVQMCSFPVTADEEMIDFVQTEFKVDHAAASYYVQRLGCNMEHFGSVAAQLTDDVRLKEIVDGIVRDKESVIRAALSAERSREFSSVARAILTALSASNEVDVSKCTKGMGVDTVAPVVTYLLENDILFECQVDRVTWNSRAVEHAFRQCTEEFSADKPGAGSSSTFLHTTPPWGRRGSKAHCRPMFLNPNTPAGEIGFKWARFWVNVFET